MHLVHLTASSFFGGPERQMLGLGRSLSGAFHSTYLSFAEGGRSAAFLEQVERHGLEAQALRNDTPNLRAALRELTTFLKIRQADLLISHGYKSNLIGRIAARRAGIPIISVSRGWTGENAKVKLYDALDRYHLRLMDAVVAVSDGQARKVRRAGVSAGKIHVIRNAARLDAFQNPLPEYREKLRQLAGVTGNEPIVLAAGRLSPEKGFDVLVESAALVQQRGTAARFVLFGEGPQRPLLEKRLAELGLRNFVLAGFHDDLDRWLPWADLVVLPSHTEGLPNVALEASAAGLPVVATAVGGTPEVVRDGLTGYLVPPGEPVMLAERIHELAINSSRRREQGEAGRRFMQDRFSFAAQAEAYQRLFEKLVPARMRRAA